MGLMRPQESEIAAASMAALLVAMGAVDPAFAADAAVDALNAAAGAAVNATGASDALGAAAGAAIGGASQASADAAEAAQAASMVPEADPNASSGDWFDPFVDFNAGIIAGIDDVVEGFGFRNTFGFAIIFYTILIKILTYPLNESALRANAKMSLIAPKMKQIQERYKNDPETLNRMTLRLYDDTGVNPLGGCIPSLLQFPIFIALYRGITRLATSNAHFKEPFLWIPSLAGPTQSGSGNLDWLIKSPYPDHFEPMIGWEPAGRYLILPVILIGTQFFTQSLSSAGQEQNNPILGVFPLLIGYSTLVSPAGLGLYWLCNNILTSGQTLLIKQQLADEYPEYKRMQEGGAKALPLEDEVSPEDRKGFGFQVNVKDTEVATASKSGSKARKARKARKGRGRRTKKRTKASKA